MTTAIESQGGALPKDVNKFPIQVARGCVYQDADPSPNVSPLTVSSTAIDLIMPDNAVVLHLLPTGDDLRFGDNATLDGTEDEGYFLLPSGTLRPIPVSGGDAVYLKRNSGDVTLFFYIEVL